MPNSGGLFAQGTSEEEKVEPPGKAWGPWTDIPYDPNAFKGQPGEDWTDPYNRAKKGFVGPEAERFAWLDQKLQDELKAQKGALGNVLAQKSVAEAGQNVGLSNAASVTNATRGGKSAIDAYRGQQQAGDAGLTAVEQSGAGRAAEDVGKLSMMRDLAQRKNQYALSTQDLWNTALGLNSSAVTAGLADRAQTNMADIYRQQQQAAIGGTLGAGAAGVAGSAFGAYDQARRDAAQTAKDEGLQSDYFSDVRLKKNVQEDEGPKEESIGDKLKGIGQAVGGMDWDPNLLGVRMPQLQTDYPERYLGKVLSGVEFKKNVSDTENRPEEDEGDRDERPTDRGYFPKREPVAQQANGQAPVDETLAFASNAINNHPEIMKRIRSGEMDERQALYVIAKNEEVQGNYSGAAKIRAVARKTPPKLEDSYLARDQYINGEYRKFDPIKQLEEDDRTQLEQQSRANAAGLAPVYGKQFQGYQPGTGSIWKDDKNYSQSEHRYIPPVKRNYGIPSSMLQPIRQYKINEPQPKVDIISGDSPVMSQMSDIKPYKYEYNDKAEDVLGKGNVPKGKIDGVIAQQVEEKNPDLVGSANGVKFLKGDKALGKSMASHGEVARKMMEIEDNLGMLESYLGKKNGRTRTA